MGPYGNRYDIRTYITRLPRYVLPITALALILVATWTIYAETIVFWACSTSPQFHSIEDGNEAGIRVSGARYESPRELLDSLRTENHQHSVGAIPAIIHQSWKTDELPLKFWGWSNSWRIRHPAWRWVLWTDDDNARLIADHHPVLNETYWALESNIQRADFIRNLYLWTIGGVYADLDMDCLRPLDGLFHKPYDSVSDSYHISNRPSHLAFVGEMETPAGSATAQSIPNAWMASSPHHPLWLLPLSAILYTLGADNRGRIPAMGKRSTVEEKTGPVALYNAIQDYRKHKSDLTTLIHPALLGYLPQAVPDHESLVLKPAIIFPFSWSMYSKFNEVYGHCRAAPGYPFDPIKCQDLLGAYENGARAITYWAHTWKQDVTQTDSDLSVVGSR